MVRSICPFPLSCASCFHFDIAPLPRIANYCHDFFFFFFNFQVNGYLARWTVGRDGASNGKPLDSLQTQITEGTSMRLKSVVRSTLNPVISSSFPPILASTFPYTLSPHSPAHAPYLQTHPPLLHTASNSATLQMSMTTLFYIGKRPIDPRRSR